MLISQYNIEVFKPKLKTYKSQFTESLDIKYEPYDYQYGVINDFLNKYKINSYVNGIIQLTTGFGKTYLSLYLANILKLKTLIIVDETFLLNQWMDRIVEYFGIDRDQIGLIRGNNIKVNDDTRFTLAYVQTLNSRLRNNDYEYLKRITELNFGLIIFDECHKVSASEKYSKISSLFDTKNIIGLSATPYKVSLQKIQLESSIGDIIISGSNYAYIPKLFIIEFHSNLYKYVTNPSDKRKIFLLKRSNDLIKARSIYSSLVTTSFPCI